MRQFSLLLVLTMMVTSSNATLVITSIETAPSQFAIQITTDVTFDSLELHVTGDVANGVNIVPVNPPLGRVLISSGTVLAPLGSPSTDGVFNNPGTSIDLTYGVTIPVPGQWSAGLTNAPFLRFDLLSGVANVTANLRLASPTIIATSTVQVSAVPEAGAVLCLSILIAGVIVAALYRRATGPKTTLSHSPAYDGNR